MMLSSIKQTNRIDTKRKSKKQEKENKINFIRNYFDFYFYQLCTEYIYIYIEYIHIAYDKLPTSQAQIIFSIPFVLYLLF